jgi:hypothetical protein
MAAALALRDIRVDDDPAGIAAKERTPEPQRYDFVCRIHDFIGLELLQPENRTGRIQAKPTHAGHFRNVLHDFAAQ